MRAETKNYDVCRDFFCGSAKESYFCYSREAMIPQKSESKPQTISISTSTLLKILAIAAGLWFLWFTREIVIMVLIAILFAALIDPFADWFAKRKVPRALAVLIVYLLIVALVLLIGFWFVPIIGGQFVQLFESISSSDGFLFQSLDRVQSFTAQYGLQENVRSALQGLQNSISSSIASIFTTVRGVFGGIAALFVILVLTFYMVVEEAAARRLFKNLAPEEYQPFLSQLFARMQNKVGAWLRAQMLLGLIIGAAVYIGLSLLGVHYALLLAILAGVLEFVPYIGPVMSIVPAIIISAAQSPMLAVFVLVLYLVIQQIENHLLVPKVMQRVTGLNPVVSIIALLLGIKLGGFVGAVLSIPIVAMASVALEDIFKDSSST